MTRPAPTLKGKRARSLKSQSMPSKRTSRESFRLFVSSNQCRIDQNEFYRIGRQTDVKIETPSPFISVVSTPREAVQADDESASGRNMRVLFRISKLTKSVSSRSSNNEKTASPDYYHHNLVQPSSDTISRTRNILFPTMATARACHQKFKIKPHSYCAYQFTNYYVGASISPSRSLLSPTREKNV